MLYLSVLVLAVQQPPADANKWQSHDLLTTPELTVRLKVRAAASMLERDWIKLEFENHTQKPLGIHFMLDATASVKPANGRPPNATLFPRLSANEFGRKNANGQLQPLATIPPGVMSAGEELLAGAIANNLGRPPEGGLQVDGKARLILNMFEVPGRKKLTTPGNGAAFSFAWRPPQGEQLKQARDELQTLLFTAPVERSEAYRLRLQMLLNIPELSRDLSTDKVLTALGRFTSNDRRWDVFRTLVMPRRKDPKIIAYYRDRIVAGDDDVLIDLIQSDWLSMPGKNRREEVYLWDRSFVEPMLALYEKDPRKNLRAFTTLERRAAEWSSDTAVTARLAAISHKLYPVLDKKLDNLERPDVEELMYGIWHLGKTRDRASLPLLAKAMDTKYPTPFPPPRIHLANMPLGSSVAHQAAMAVVQITDGEHALQLWAQQRGAKKPPTVDDVIDYAKVRLKAEEEERKKGK